MTLDLALPLAAVFISVALAVGSLASMALARTSPVRRRLQPTVGLRQRFAGRASFDQLSLFLRPAATSAQATVEGAARGVDQRVAAAAPAWSSPAGRIRTPPAITRWPRWSSPIVFGLLPLALMGTQRLAAGARRRRGRLYPSRLHPDARDAAPSEGDSERPAGRDRSDRRLRRGRIEPRPGDHARERRARARAAGAGARAANGDQRDPGRQTAARSLPGTRQTHAGRGRARARHDADPDRPLRHEHRAGAAARTPRRRAPSGGSGPKSAPPRSASSSCFRSRCVWFPRFTSSVSVQSSSGSCARSRKESRQSAGSFPRRKHGGHHNNRPARVIFASDRCVHGAAARAGSAAKNKRGRSARSD